MANAQNQIQITINGHSLTATLADTEAAQEFATRLRQSPVSVRMTDYGGFEKVGDLPWSLPASDSQITTSAGDIMLYQGHSIVIFYGRNSWAYTPLGKINGADAAEIRSFLAEGPVDVTFAADTSTSINAIETDSHGKHEVVTLQGRKICLGSRSLSGLPEGFYIIDGKKQFIK